MASLRLVIGTQECPAQEDTHPYRDLPGGFSQHLRGALFSPWIIGGNLMTPWEACIVGAEWAHEWSRWCTTTNPLKTPAAQYDAVPLEGSDTPTRPQPTLIRGVGPERPWDAEITEWLQAASQPHTGWWGDVFSLLWAPVPPLARATHRQHTPRRGDTCMGA